MMHAEKWESDSFTRTNQIVEFETLGLSEKGYKLSWIYSES